MKKRFRLLLLAGILTLSANQVLPSSLVLGSDSSTEEVETETEEESEVEKDIKPETEAPVVETEEKVPETEVSAPETEAQIPETEAQIPETEAPETQGPETEEPVTESETEIETETETETETESETESETEETESTDISETNPEKDDKDKLKERNKAKETEKEETEDPAVFSMNYQQITGEPIYVLGNYPAANVTQNTNRVYDYLTKKLGLNHAAACGVLANIQCESNFSTTAVGDGGTSYGLCQWHLERFSALISFCVSNGYDFHMLEGQMEYLSHELNTGYQEVLQHLKNVPNTPEGAYEAGYYWCKVFERPNHLEYNSQMRGDLARGEYYSKDLGTKKKTVKKPVVAVQKSVTDIIIEEAPEELQSVGIMAAFDKSFVDELVAHMEDNGFTL